MNGIPLSPREIRKIKFLRRTGHSISEIMRTMHRGKTTIFYHIQDVQILPQYESILKAKQGVSKKRSEQAWIFAKAHARSLFENFDRNTKLLIAAILYWGEGAKKDFSLSNTDPKLIKVFVTCLKELGITTQDLKVTIRTYEDLDTKVVKRYWANIIGVPVTAISNVNVLKGKKNGKLEYGMCRIRVKRGGVHLKLFQSIVELIAERVMPL